MIGMDRDVSDYRCRWDFGMSTRHLSAHSWRNKKGSATFMWRHLAARPPVPERERRVTRIHPLWQLAIWQPRGLANPNLQNCQDQKKCSIEAFCEETA